MALAAWAVPALSKLLPLDNESLKEIIEYTNTLSKDAAADHLKNLLGDSPQAFEFIASFNSRRQTPTTFSQAASSSQPGSGSSTPRENLSEVPKVKRHAKKPNKFNQLPAPRRPDDYGNVAGGYLKRDEDDYIAGKPKAHPAKEPHLADTLALQEKPDAVQTPVPTSGTSSKSSTSKLPPSAAGPTIADIQTQSKSRSSSPAKAKAKIAVTGGTPMHGASTALNDLDSAIRTLELQTNPSLTSFSASDNAKRRCQCMATRHPLLEAAPNCQNCGKIICVKEGLGPCTFCEKPLLSSAEIQGMIRALREERGKERMEANNSSQKRADVSKAPRPFANLAKPGATTLSATASPFASTPASSAPSSDSETEKLLRAKEHRDRLLAFQANNARRTRVHDEAADFETTTAGLNMWASPQERALQLKRQQKVLREQEWSARPEWEKRQVVASIDISTGKIMRRMGKVERPRTPESDAEEVPDVEESSGGPVQAANGGSGAFGRNPLLGGMIRPVARVDDAGNGKQTEVREKRPTWRRVQDDETDNEAIILDGGAFGGEVRDEYTKAEEPACG